MRAIFCEAVLKNMYSRFSDQLWHVLTAHIFVWLCMQLQNSVYDMCDLHEYTLHVFKLWLVCTMVAM